MSIWQGRAWRIRGVAGFAIAALLLVGSARPGWAASSRTPDRVRASISAFLRARAPQPVTAIELPGLGDFDVPGFETSDLEIRLQTRHAGTFVGRVAVTVVLMSGEREVKRGVVTAHVRIDVPVFVATRALRRGERIGPNDVREERRDLSKLRGVPLRTGAQIVGRRVARAVREGEVWLQGRVETVPVVSRGETVRLRLSRGNLRIDGMGRAREDGRPGDWIRVLNTASRREVSGQVSEDGVVHVRF